MNDLISRQAAIDALRKAENYAFNSFYKGLVKAHKIITDMPSAQPELIRCKDCKWWRDDNATYTYCQKLFNMGVLDAYDYMTEENDYCSRAERREDG